MKKFFAVPMVPILVLSMLSWSAPQGAPMTLHALLEQQSVPMILPDSRVVFGPRLSTFRTQQFLDGFPGILRDLHETVEGNSMAASDMINLVAHYYSLNPKLILALIEFRSGLVSEAEPPREAMDFALGHFDAHDKGFLAQLTWAAQTIVEGYYGYKTGVSGSFTLTDGTLIDDRELVNAGSYAIRRLLAMDLPPEQWQSAVSRDNASFYATYVKLFGDPFAEAMAQGPEVRIESQPMLHLPWNIGDTWYYTAGPHRNDGCTNWENGICQDNWGILSSVDFAPTGDYGKCDGNSDLYVPGQWVLAAGDGVVTFAANSLVEIDHDGDGDPGTGWATSYFHLYDDSIQVPWGASVSSGAALGNPSCQAPGGQATAPHLHFSVRRDGEFVDIGGLVISGWTVHDGPHQYQGSMTKPGEADRYSNNWRTPSDLVSDNPGYCGVYRNVVSNEVAYPPTIPCEIVPQPNPTTDSATFVSDVTLPDGTVVSPGQALNKVWRVRNSGTSTWGNGYQLVFIGGDQMGAPSAVDVPGTVSPNATVDLSVDMTAPSNSRHYVGHWRLRNAQNVYFGDELWIDVVVQGDPQEGDITVLSVNYPSVVAPGEQFRPEIRVRVNTGALLESRGDMLRNTDGNLYGAWPHVAVVGTVNTGQEYAFRFYEDNPITAPSSLGTYESRWRVWQDGRYVGPEIVIRFEVQPSGSLNHPPNPPTLVAPPDYHVSETGAPTLRAQHNGDPDGDSITAYYFEIFDSHDNPNSGWISQNSWTPPGLGLYGYKWHAKVRDSRGAESGWSETRHFLIEDPGPQIYDFHWEWCRPAWGGPEKICFCADTNAGTLRVQVNMATDGSENGEWKIINELGVPQYMCSSDDDRPPNWAQLEAETGTHLARLYARREGGWEAAATADLLIYLPPDRRPNSPYGQHPPAGAYVDSQTVRFEWLKTLRTTDYHLVAGTTPDLSQNLLLDVHLPADTPEYTHTFDDDYSTIYWEVTSTGPYGTNEASSHFHIDVDPPASAVNALPAVMTEAVFPVNWGGSDAGSGLHWYDVQFRDGERGEWVTWMAETTATGALFRGEPGHTYYFRGRAMDEVGNWEAYPGGDGDTHTLVDPTAAPPTEWWNQDYAYKRNVIVLNNDSHTLPSGYPVRLYFDASTTPTAEELYNASQSPNKGDDFRVIYDNATELDRYVRRFGPSEIDIWFQTQASVSSTASDDSYQIYYGNPSPGSPPGDITTVMVPPNDANTIGLWHLQEEEGSTAHDGSGHDHDGTLVNSPAWSADGKWGSCLHFDGIDGQHIDLGNSSVWDLDTFTIEAWVYPEQASGRIVSRAKQPGTSDPILYTLEMKNWKPFYWSEDGGGTIWSPSTIPANKWAHLAATRDGSRSKLFVNGVEVGSLPHGSWDDTANGSLILAGRLQGCYQGFRVSNVARSSFPYGEFAQITDEPSVAAGDAIAQPSPGTPDLAVQSLATYPTTSGGVIVQAVVRNEGNASTTNGFYTDLYADHKPTGAGDYTGSVRFWIASPIEPGATVTLTTVLTDVTGAGGLSAAALGPLSETSVTLYTQADSSGVVRETDNLDNISTGLDVCIANPDAYENAATSSNLLINGSFEDGSYAPDAAPAAWTQDAWNWSASTFIWDDAQAHDGNRSVRITNDDFNDARWAQTVTVEPNTDYRLSGWIKTENVAHTQESIDAGANLSVFDSPEFRIWTYVGELFGTNDWTYVSLVFNSGDVTELTIAARLGYWYGTTTGTAWFDDIRLEPLYASPLGDDIPANAQPIALDETQRRNFDRLGDQDWVRFTAQGGMTYTIQTSNLGLAADTYLYLYDTDGSTLLAANDDYGGSLASQLEWAAPATGDYYILVKHWNPNVGGCGTAYDLTVMRALTNKLFLPIILKNR